MVRPSLSATVLSALAVCLLAASPALASSEPGASEPAAAEPGATPEGWAYQLPNYLMSPFCPGKTLADCTSPQASNLRMWMIVQEAAGRTQTDVEAELFERYGDVLRPAPKAEGFGVTAYAVPVLAFLGGGTLIGVFLRRQTRPRVEPTPAQSAPVAADGELSDLELERIIDREIAS
jgi:cytochrome c-type biogenesis protein CcmH/NrfF